MCCLMDICLRIKFFCKFLFFFFVNEILLLDNDKFVEHESSEVTFGPIDPKIFP